MSDQWDKKLTKELLKLGLSREQAGVVVGVVSDHRQQAYIDGYKNGYNDGSANNTHKRA